MTLCGFYLVGAGYIMWLRFWNVGASNIFHTISVSQLLKQNSMESQIRMIVLVFLVPNYYCRLICWLSSWIARLLTTGLQVHSLLHFDWTIQEVSLVITKRKYASSLGYCFVLCGSFAELFCLRSYLATDKECHFTSSRTEISSF